MSWVKATVRLIHAWRHPDEIAREVEAELRFHIEMRARANIQGGMRPDEAQLAALESFGDFDRVKVRCCEISRSLPFDSTPLRMGLHIAIAVLAGGAALWAVNIPHHNFIGVLRQLVAIAVLTRLFVIVRRSISTELCRNNVSSSDVCEERNGIIAPHDERGRTPVERIFNSE
jgi:hypothetical protein